MLRKISMMFLVIMTVNLCYSFEVTGYGPEEYLGGTDAQLSQMEQNLGIESMVIEDFEGLVLDAPRLSLSGDGIYSNPVVLQNNGWGTQDSGYFRVLTLNEVDVTIQIDGGTLFLGIGLSALESNTETSLTSFSINGQTPIALHAASFPAFIFRPNQRNGYLTISSEIGEERIYTVTFSTAIGVDGYQFDYIAFDGSCTLELRSDINGDCRVNLEDLSIMASEWLLCGLVTGCD